MTCGRKCSSRSKRTVHNRLLQSAYLPHCRFPADAPHGKGSRLEARSGELDRVQVRLPRLSNASAMDPATLDPPCPWARSHAPVAAGPSASLQGTASAAHPRSAASRSIRRGAPPAAERLVAEPALTYAPAGAAAPAPAAVPGLASAGPVAESADSSLYGWRSSWSSRAPGGAAMPQRSASCGAGSAPSAVTARLHSAAPRVGIFERIELTGQRSADGRDGVVGARHGSCNGHVDSAGAATVSGSAGSWVLLPQGG